MAAAWTLRTAQAALDLVVAVAVAAVIIVVVVMVIVSVNRMIPWIRRKIIGRLGIG
jgi:hypothetical protein